MTGCRVVNWFQTRGRFVDLRTERCSNRMKHCFDLGAQLHADVSGDFVARNRQQSFKLDLQALGRRDCRQQDSFALRILELASGALE